MTEVQTTPPSQTVAGLTIAEAKKQRRKRDYHAIRKRPRNWALAALLAAPLGVVTSLLGRQRIQMIPGVTVADGWPLGTLVLGLVVLVCVGFWTWLVLRALSFIRDVVTGYAEQSVRVILIVYVVAALSLSVSSPVGAGIFLFLSRQSIGVAFILLLSVVTVLGFVITISSLKEYQNNIKNYSTFLDRLGRFLDKVIDDSDSARPDFPINMKILCSVPTLGNLTHYKYHYPGMYAKLVKLAKNPSVHIGMSCLGFSVTPDQERSLKMASETKVDGIDISDFDQKGLWGDVQSGEVQSGRTRRVATIDGLLSGNGPMGRFYKSVKGNHSQAAKVEDTRRAYAQAFEMISLLSEDERGNRIIVYDNFGTGLPGPPCHLFLTETRALIAVPLNRDMLSEGPVTLIGYETSDQEIINKLTATFQEWTETVQERKRRNHYRARRSRVRARRKSSRPTLP